jgi:drug/metabolite transporter (DMT)-like permease
VLLIWGLTYSFVKLGLEFSPPIWLAFLRTSTGLAGTLVLQLVLRTDGSLNNRQKVAAFFLGVPGIAIFFGFWMIGELTVPPGETSVFIYTFPIWTMILSIPILRDSPSPSRGAAALLGFGGVVLVASAGNASWTGNLVSIISLLAAAISFALDTVLFKRIFVGKQVLSANLWQLGGGSLILLVWAFSTEPSASINWTLQLAGSIFWLGVLATAVVFLLWFRLLTQQNATSLTSYTSLVVVVALVASFFISGEAVNSFQLMGVIALIASASLVSRSHSKGRVSGDQT